MIVHVDSVDTRVGCAHRLTNQAKSSLSLLNHGCATGVHPTNVGHGEGISSQWSSKYLGSHDGNDESSTLALRQKVSTDRS